MLQDFDEQYVLPDRKYFSQTAIPEKYLTVKDDIIRDLKDFLSDNGYVVKRQHDAEHEAIMF